MRAQASIRVWMLAIGCGLHVKLSYGDSDVCALQAERAQRERIASDWLTSIAHLRECSRSSCPEMIRTDCARWLGELEHDIPTFAVRVLDSSGNPAVGASVTVDDHPRLQASGLLSSANPGTHVIRVEGARDRYRERTAVLAAGEKNIVIELRPEAPSLPPPSASSPPSASPGRTERQLQSQLPIAANVADGTARSSWFLLPLGLGSAALLTGGAFWVSGFVSRQALAGGCGPSGTCAETDVRRAKQQFLVGDLLLGASALLLGVSGYLFFSQTEAKRPATSMSMWTVGMAHSRSRKTF
jgi:hypothetical protein